MSHLIYLASEAGVLYPRNRVMVENLYVLTYSRDNLPFIEFITVLTTAYHCSYPKPHESAYHNFVHNNPSFLMGGGKLK
jgi:hypothetical protein